MSSRTPPIWTAMLAIAAFAVFLLGCAGGDGDEPEGPVEVKAGLADLQSYKCTLKIEGSGTPFAASSSGATPGATATAGQKSILEAAVTYVKPDKSIETIKLDGESYSLTTIGRQQWSTSGSITVGPTEVGSGNSVELSLCATWWDEMFVEADAPFQCNGARATVNGAETRRCEVKASTAEQLKQVLAAAASDVSAGVREVSKFEMELWVTTGAKSLAAGLPVRLRADIAGKDTANRDFSLHIEMDVSNMNDEKLSVTPPK